MHNGVVVAEGMILKKKPLISAWIGQGNFGDELLSYGLRLELCKAFDIERFSYYEKGYDKIYVSADEPEIASLNTDGMRRWRRIFRNYLQFYKGYDSLFFGGGSILHSSHSVDWKYNLLRRFRYSRLLSSSIAGAVGISVGPFSDASVEYKVGRFLSELDVIHCRDKASVEFVRKLECRGQIIDGRDLAFSVRAMRPHLFEKKIKHGYIGASFILDPKLNAVEQSEQFHKILSVVNLISGLGYKLILVSLYTGRKYSDHHLHRRLRDASREPSMIELVDYTGDVPSTISQIASCDFYISMRLHGAVTAYLAAVPFFAISSHPKMIEFCLDIFGESETSNLGALSMAGDELLELLRNSIALSKKQPTYTVGQDDKYYMSSSEFARAVGGGYG